MSKKYLVDIDLNGNELQNAVIQNLASAPENPKEGQSYYNTTDKKFCFYENGVWVKFATLTEFNAELAKKLDVATYTTDKAELENSIAAAKKAGDDAQADLNAYKVSNDAAVALKANDNAVVHLAGAESIDGVKTFANGLKSGEAIDASSNDTTVATTAFVKSSISAAEGDIMHLSGEETVTGDKTFSGSVFVPTVAAGTNTTDAASTAFVKTAVDTADATAVHKTGNESVAGTKTFTGSIVATAATVTVKDQNQGDNSSNAANTKYVDAAAKAVKDELDSYKTANDAEVAKKAADDAVVHLTGDETIAGVKTFSSLPVVGTAAADDNSTQAASTAFVKNKVETYTYSKSDIDNKIAEKDSLPEQAEHAGEWLTTNGTDAAWSALPIATASSLGVVKVGTNLSVSADGTISTTANVASVAGKTGVVTLDKTDVGLDKVDNTADLDKPISTATQAALDGKADKATTLAGYGIADAYTKTEIDGKIASVYKPAGSIAFAGLPTLAANVLGNVYNVTDAFTTTADFVEGEGKKHPAGTNVVVVNTGTNEDPVYKFDVLAGFVDLSDYSTTAQIAENYMNKTDLANTYLTQENAAATYATKDEVAEGSVHRVSKTNPQLTVAGGTATWSITDLAADPYAITIVEVASGEEVITEIVYGVKAATIRMNASADVAANTYKAYILM